MSDSTTSAPPSSAARSRAGADGVEKIEQHEVDTSDRLYVENVDRDDLSPALGGSDAPRRNVAPAAGRRAQIHDTPTRLQQAVLIVDLDQLVGGA